MFGDRLKEIRNQKGITQKELAEKLNMKQQAISHFERNIEMPKIATVEKLAAALEVTPDVFFPGNQKSAELIFRGYSSFEQNAPGLYSIKHNWPETDSGELNPDIVDRIHREQRLLGHFQELNPQGQEKAVEQVELLTQIPKYQAAAAPDPEDREPPETEKDPHS